MEIETKDGNKYIWEFDWRKDDRFVSAKTWHWWENYAGFEKEEQFQKYFTIVGGGQILLTSLKGTKEISFLKDKNVICTSKFYSFLNYYHCDNISNYSHIGKIKYHLHDRDDADVYVNDLDEYEEVQSDRSMENPGKVVDLKTLVIHLHGMRIFEEYTDGLKKYRADEHKGPVLLINSEKNKIIVIGKAFHAGFDRGTWGTGNVSSVGFAVDARDKYELKIINIIDKDKEKVIKKDFETKRDKLLNDFKSEHLDLMSKIEKKQENFEKTFKIEDESFTDIKSSLENEYIFLNNAINNLEFSNRNLLSNYSFDKEEYLTKKKKSYKDYSEKIPKTLTAFNQKIETYEKNKNEILAKLSKFNKLTNENKRIIEQLRQKDSLMRQLGLGSYDVDINNYLLEVDLIKRQILFVKNYGELDKINIDSFAELNLIKTMNSQYTLEELEDRVEQKRTKDKIDNVLEEGLDEIPA